MNTNTIDQIIAQILLNGVTDLRNALVPTASTLRILKYLTVPGDTRGGQFYWDVSNTTPDDGDSYINPTANGSNAGRFVRI